MTDLRRNGMEGISAEQLFEMLEAASKVSSMSGLESLAGYDPGSVDFGICLWMDTIGTDAESIINFYESHGLALPEVFGSCLKEIDSISTSYVELLNIVHDLDAALKEYGSEEELIRQVKEKGKFLLAKLKP